MTVCRRYVHRIKNIETLIADGGDITIGMVAVVGCAATAAEGYNALAMLVRLEGETISALPRRLDKAVGRYYIPDESTDKINQPW